MFSDLLFQHRYDIDTLLEHWCAAPLPAGRVYMLNTEDGTITEEAATTPESKTLHSFTPLPFATTVEELSQLATTDARAEGVADILATCQTMPDIYHSFDTSHAGGWLRNSIKTFILDWLDDRNMIPPSMRHVRLKPKAEATPLPTAKTTINIQ